MIFLVRGDRQVLIEVLPSRTTFEAIAEIVKRLFWALSGDHAEKVLLAKKRANELPVFTHYKTQQYKEVIRVTEGKGVTRAERDDAFAKWKAIGEYYIAGYDIRIEARKVEDVHILEGYAQPQVIEWIDSRGKRQLPFTSPSLATRIIDSFLGL